LKFGSAIISNGYETTSLSIVTLAVYLPGAANTGLVDPFHKIKPASGCSISL